jgi:probable HAF family extracellular repeat protein
MRASLMIHASRLPRVPSVAVCAYVATGILFLGIAIPARASSAGAAARYTVKDLGTLGGSFSAGNGINDLRWVVGASNLAGNSVQHATLWFRGFQFDLGTPGGINSAVDWPVRNDHGLIVGNGEIATTDPLGENFCRYGTGLECRGFAWNHGVMTTLSTLGGNNSYAAGANNRGLVVGWAEDATQDPTCTLPQVLQYEAVVWSPSFHAQQLPPLPGDSDGAAVAINNSQQVVGISGPCADADGNGAAHAVLWQDGTPTDLKNFGGTVLNTADAINDRGQVVGFSALTGNTTLHAFLWTASTGIQDLGTLPGDTLSEALGINNRGQIVGGSCDASFNCRAFIWEKGVMRDLNTLIPHLSPLYLNFAGDINEQGDIGGLAFDQRTGIAPAFMAIPRAGGHGHSDASPRPNMVLPQHVRQMLRRWALDRIGPGARTAP